MDRYKILQGCEPNPEGFNYRYLVSKDLTIAATCSIPPYPISYLAGGGSLEEFKSDLEVLGYREVTL